jgi:hypothetical protein
MSYSACQIGPPVSYWFHSNGTLAVPLREPAALAAVSAGVVLDVGLVFGLSICQFERLSAIVPISVQSASSSMSSERFFAPSLQPVARS